MHVESILLFENPEAIFARVFTYIRPRTAVPPIQAAFCEFANANSSIQFKEGQLHVRITDVLADAPAPILEALAYILLSKLYRRAIPRIYDQRYRLYLNRKDIRHRLEQMRKLRGHKLTTGAKGAVYDLEDIFGDLNVRYFHGLMAQPELGWSLRVSRSTLGHYDPSHHTIILSKILDRAEVPKLAVDYVMFHEMLASSTPR